jgi:surface protein
MFKVTSEFDQDIGTWNVARVESFGSSCSNAAYGTSCEASTLGGMFFEALKFNRDLSNWNVASATDMYGAADLHTRAPLLLQPYMYVSVASSAGVACSPRLGSSIET